MSKEAMKLALEALKNLEPENPYSLESKAINALEEALANHYEDNLDMVKQEQGEPVATPQAIYNKVCLGLAEAGCKLSEQQKMALASLVQETTPQQRTWVGLTDEEVEKLDCGKVMWQELDRVEIHGVKEFYRNIEAKLKEKNT